MREIYRPEKEQEERELSSEEVEKLLDLRIEI